MARASSFRFNGYKFEFVTDVGVVILEAAEVVDRPEFQKALKTALTLYSYWNRATFLTESAHYREPTSDEFIELQEIVGSCPDVEFGLRLYDDLLRAEKYRKRQEEAELARQLERNNAGCTPGYVYLAVGDKGFYKIGKAKSPKTRLNSLRKGGVVEYVCVIKTDDYSGLERTLHEQFAEKRQFGEWFQLDANEIEYIKSLAVQP